MLYGRQPEVHLPAVDKPSNADSDEYSTLIVVRDELRSSMDGIDKWHAFDTVGDALTIKQQIVAHQLAYNIVAPLLDAIQSAIDGVDRKYNRNRR